MNSKGKITGEGCLKCPIAGICGGAAMTDADVPESLRWRAIVLTLVVPLALLLVGLGVAWKLGVSQGMSAMSALLLPSLYYLSFYAYSKILK